MTDNIVHLRVGAAAGRADRHQGHLAVPGAEVHGHADARSARATTSTQRRRRHKLGMHASPTCTMTMGDKGGAIGYLIGEENRGMLCMFTMMNQAPPRRRP